MAGTSAAVYERGVSMCIHTTVKDLYPTIPVLKAGYPSVLHLYSCCVCVFVLFVCGVLGLGFLSSLCNFTSVLYTCIFMYSRTSLIRICLDSS